MAGRLETALYRAVERHKTSLNIAGWLCFAAVCADYARFIELPDIVMIPTAIGGMLTAVRVVVWESFVEPRFEHSTQDGAVKTDV